MTDFVAYEPSRSAGRDRAGLELPELRAATPADVEDLAAVMSARGGSVEDHRGGASRLVAQLPVLVVADAAGVLVGWSGARPNEIRPFTDRGWLVAGLAVVPERRRQGIATRLLAAVIRAVGDLEPEEPVFSIVNVRNRASVDLHEHQGFAEVARGASFAGIEFTGGEGVLLRFDPAPTPG